eukprot:CFRG2401T1
MDFIGEYFEEAWESLHQLTENLLNSIDIDSSISGESSDNVEAMNKNGKFWEELKTFFATVDWTESWLVVLIGFHVLTFITVLSTRNYMDFQFVLFLLLMALCCGSSYVNDYAALNWKSFAGEQYFDSHGFFIVMIFAAPILINCCVLVAIWLVTVSKMLVVAKRAEIRKNVKNKRSEAESSVAEEEVSKDATNSKAGLVKRSNAKAATSTLPIQHEDAVDPLSAH